MEDILKYWPIIDSFILPGFFLIVGAVFLAFRVLSLEEKVRTLFNLWNKKNEGDDA